ncbi:MAG: helix-turn-helix domain-containing protein [Ignavibacteriaceae bacterium]|nr:helix-turn-helix domain-containing protein [Ignavibacteriaceae bacterium]
MSEKLTLNIKNMVCNRCIKVVREEMEKLGYQVLDISLGEVELQSNEKISLDKIKAVLEVNGFELIDDKNSRIIEKIKLTVINKMKELSEGKISKVNYAKAIADETSLSYQYISTLFSSIEGTTIEKFIIMQKIEKVKELLVYDELTLSEIAYRLEYSSVQHLSNQFKKVTGLTPSYFKQFKNLRRKPIDKVI